MKTAKGPPDSNECTNCPVGEKRHRCAPSAHCNVVVDNDLLGRCGGA